MRQELVVGLGEERPEVFVGGDDVLDLVELPLPGLHIMLPLVERDAVVDPVALFCLAEELALLGEELGEQQVRLQGPGEQLQLGGREQPVCLVLEKVLLQ